MDKGRCGGLPPATPPSPAASLLPVYQAHPLPAGVSTFLTNALCLHPLEATCLHPPSPHMQAGAVESPAAQWTVATSHLCFIPFLSLHRGLVSLPQPCLSHPPAPALARPLLPQTLWVTCNPAVSYRLCPDTRRSREGCN